MLQCLTQLIIRQTSIRFHSLPTAADHGTELFFLQITRHFGGCCDHMLELSLCCVPKVCAQRSLAMYSPMSYVGSHLWCKEWPGPVLSPLPPPRTDKCPSHPMYKTNSNTTQGSNIFMCAHFFPVYILAECNIYGTILYMWCQRCHLILKLLK